MNEIRTRVLVGSDRRITGTAPVGVPPGEHEVTIAVPDQPAPLQPSLLIEDSTLPRHDLGQWPEALSLRREDIYDDDGR
jgi:hypothetical protein